jgi:hypothetical protein
VRLVKCRHCNRATTAINAGVDPPPVKRHHAPPVTPATILPLCSRSSGHSWLRMPGEDDSIVCAHCAAEARYIRRVASGS